MEEVLMDEVLWEIFGPVLVSCRFSPPSGELFTYVGLSAGSMWKPVADKALELS